MADLLPISERLYDLSILLVFRFDDTYEHDVLLNHHIPVEEVRECLDSVASQTHRPLEIVVVNDGSTDNTEEVALGWWENLENREGLSFVYLALHATADMLRRRASLITSVQVSTSPTKTLMI